MDRKRMDGWQFWALVAIADRERNQVEIRNRMVALLRTSGEPNRVPANVKPLLQALLDGGLVEKLGGGGLFERANYRVTAAGHEACRTEIGLRRRELDTIEKDKDVRRWLGGAARR